MNNNYLFTSKRLGFREWSLNDLDAFYLLNSDEEVMEHFPKTLTKEETKAYIIRLQNQYKIHGHNYYATELKESGEFIGFIGLAYQDFESDFTPNVDIGWRLKKSAWGKGYATEGAKRCLDIAFNQLNLNKIISTCILDNKASEKIMQKIGMQKICEFKHPKLKEYPEIQTCLLYEITR
jgi:RimJ/RimL family protein N-acetyltransferase